MRFLACSTLLLIAGGCATSLDHQAELLLHPSAFVQGPALLGALPGALVGAPLWGPAALALGPGHDAPGTILHLIAYPGIALFAGIPWLIAGPSWEYR